MPALPDIGFGVVDVRDVADLHVRALNAPGMAGEALHRLGPVHEAARHRRRIARRARAEAHKVLMRGVPDRLVRLMARFNPVARAVIGELGSARHQDSPSHAKQCSRLGAAAGGSKHRRGCARPDPAGHRQGLKRHGAAHAWRDPDRRRRHRRWHDSSVRCDRDCRRRQAGPGPPADVVDAGPCTRPRQASVHRWRAVRCSYALQCGHAFRAQPCRLGNQLGRARARSGHGGLRPPPPGRAACDGALLRGGALGGSGGGGPARRVRPAARSSTSAPPI